MRSSLAWTLRVGAFMCFVGHGAFGVITKPGWTPYFAVVGIGPDTAYMWMPLIGTLDIVLGVLILLRPRPAILYWMVAWALWTALLRPLAHEPVWEFFERAGNYGVPIALICLTVRPDRFRGCFAAARACDLSADVLRRTRIVLVAATALLLIGHGALGVISKRGLITNYAAVVPSHAAAIAPVIGWIEIAAGVAVVLLPSIWLALAVCAWKIATESLFVVAGAPVWEFVERGGSYAAPLVLAMVLWTASRSSIQDVRDPVAP